MGIHWKCLFVLSFIILSSINLYGDESQLLTGLEYGQYQVGFQLLEVYDYGRPFYNKTTNDFGSRPVQISVWYPASSDSAGVPLKYRDLVLNSSREVDFTELSEKEKNEFLTAWKTARLGRGVKEKIFDSILEIDLLARKGAEQEKGKFPLIIYSPSFNSSPYENVIIIEYLVTHGYIVASYPSNGQYTGVMEGTWQGVISCARDAEFVLGQMWNYPGVDNDKIGGAGFSWGGITMSYLATENYLFDAFICMDGSLIKNFGGNSWKDFPYYNPDKVIVPFMHMANKHYREDPEWEFHAGIKKAPVFQLTFPNNEHYNFCSAADIIDYEAKKDRLKRPVSTSSEKGFGQEDEREEKFFNIAETMKKDKIRLSYEVVAIYSLKFFDACLKGKDDSYKFLNVDPEQHGYSKNLMNIKIKNGKSEERK